WRAGRARGRITSYWNDGGASMLASPIYPLLPLSVSLPLTLPSPHHLLPSPLVPPACTPMTRRRVESGEGEGEDYILLASDGGASVPASAAAAPAVVHKPADTDSLAVKEQFIHCKYVVTAPPRPQCTTSTQQSPYAMCHVSTAALSPRTVYSPPRYLNFNLPPFPPSLLPMSPCHHPSMPPPVHATTRPCHHPSMPPPVHATTRPCHHPSMPPPVHATTRPCHHQSMPPPVHATTSPCHHPTIFQYVEPCFPAPTTDTPFDGTPPPASSSRLLRCRSAVPAPATCAKRTYVERRYQAPATDNPLTALHHLQAAVASCDVRSAFRLLVTAPVDVNADVVGVVASTAPAGPGTTRGSAGRRGQRLLHVACERGNEAMVELLLLWGAVVNVTDGEGRTPMQVALQHGNHGCSKLLASRCVVPPKVGQTVLM
ncbi:unnamed protein product, partial [Closterium sp. Naga37s-1]